MELYIDGERTDHDEAATTTIDDLLDVIRQETAANDRAILGLVCDGIDVFGEDLTDTLAKPASAFGRIEVQTGDRTPMMVAALEEARSTLEAAEGRYSEVIGLLAEGKTQSALQLLGGCIENWHQINEVIGQSLVLMCANDESLQASAVQFSKTVSPVRDKLLEVRQAVADKDYVTLADILEYEFEEVGACWRDAIDGITAKILSSGNATG